MKKLLITLSLILCLVLALGSCDGLGEKPTEAGTTGGTEAPTEGATEAPTEAEDANIGAIEDAINSGTSFGDIIDGTQESFDLDEIITALAEAFAELELEANFTMTQGEATQTGGLVYKDSVLVVNEDGELRYMFIEDDLTLVYVDADPAGEGYDGYADGTLAQYMSMLSAFLPDAEGEPEGDAEEDIELDDILAGIIGGSSDIIGGADMMESIDLEAFEEFFTAISDMTLPEITEEDIIYEDERYYLSDEYLKEAIGSAFEEILTEYAKAFPDQMEEAYVETAMESFNEYYDAVGLSIWFNADDEEIVGLGFEIDPDIEALGGAESGIESVFLSFDIDETGLVLDMSAEAMGMSVAANVGIQITENNVQTEISACVMNGEEVEYSIEMSTAIALDDDGVPVSLACKTTAVTPFSSSAPTDDGDFVYLKAHANVTESLTIDLSKLEEGGEFITVDVSMLVTGYTAYTYNESFEYVPDEALSAQYADDAMRLSISIKGAYNVSEEEISLTVSYSNVDTLMDLNESSTASLSVSFIVDEAPVIPAEVLAAKDAAIEEYENGGIFDDLFEGITNGIEE